MDVKSCNLNDTTACAFNVESIQVKGNPVNVTSIVVDGAVTDISGRGIQIPTNLLVDTGIGKIGASKYVAVRFDHSFTGKIEFNGEKPQGMDLFVREAKTVLAKQANTTSGLITDGNPSVPVKYTYTEANTGTQLITNLSVTDDNCSPVTFLSGDTNGNGILDPGETWTFTCTHLFTSPGNFTNTAFATGTLCFNGDCSKTDGVLTGDPTNPDNDPAERDSKTVDIERASTILTKQANTTFGEAPFPVKYTYKESNDGTVPLSGASVTDDICSPVNFVSGDAVL